MGWGGKQLHRAAIPWTTEMTDAGNHFDELFGGSDEESGQKVKKDKKEKSDKKEKKEAGDKKEKKEKGDKKEKKEKKDKKEVPSSQVEQSAAAAASAPAEVSDAPQQSQKNESTPPAAILPIVESQVSQIAADPPSGEPGLDAPMNS